MYNVNISITSIACCCCECCCTPGRSYGQVHSSALKCTAE